MSLEYKLYGEEEILERVDEYALYSFYLGYQPKIGGKYTAPPALRKGYSATKDEVPSFGLFEPRKKAQFYEFLWSDQGTGNAGNVFVLIQRMYGLSSRRQTLDMVMADFGIGGTPNPRIPLEPPERQYADVVDIAVTSKPFTSQALSLWKRWNIDKVLLERYTTTQIKQYWIAEDQREPNYPPGGLGFAYREWDKYQLYFPLEDNRKYRFRHNYTEACVHGLAQLEYNQELCIVTKSRKDVMCLRSFGYEAIAPRSENTLVPDVIMNHIRRRYKRVVVLFDNDMKHSGDRYPEEKVYVPDKATKDTSDFCALRGAQLTAEMLKTILQV